MSPEKNLVAFLCNFYEEDLNWCCDIAAGAVNQTEPHFMNIINCMQVQLK